MTCLTSGRTWGGKGNALPFPPQSSKEGTVRATSGEGTEMQQIPPPSRNCSYRDWDWSFVVVKSLSFCPTFVFSTALYAMEARFAIRSNMF